MVELVSKLGLNIQFGLEYSTWSNGINERNHASANITIMKLLENKKVQLSNVLVKVAS